LFPGASSYQRPNFRQGKQLTLGRIAATRTIFVAFGSPPGSLSKAFNSPPTTIGTLIFVFRRWQRL
jgi:hypothetical protein